MANSESSVAVSASDADSSHSKPWQSYHTVYTNAKAGKKFLEHGGWGFYESSILSKTSKIRGYNL